MKDLIKKILREEFNVDDKKDYERISKLVVKYMSVRPLPNFVCFSTIVPTEHGIIVLLHYNKSTYGFTDYEPKLQNEIKKVLNTKLFIMVTGFFSEEKSCEERLETLKRSDDWKKKFFLIPNKNFNP